MLTKIAVIGSNSFSGSDFIDLILEKKRFKVIGISRSPEKSDIFLPYKRHGSSRFSFFQMDLNQDLKKICRFLNDFKPQYVVNFAAQSEVAPSWEHPEHWFQTNTVALAGLINHLRSAKYLKKYLHISSPEVYGSCEGTVTEKAPLNPSTPYAASKAAADLLLMTFVKNFNFPLITIRSTNVYGAHQQLFKIIPRSIINIRKGIKIRLHGGGRAVKSYIHIRDISRGELLVLQKGKIGEIYHLSPARGISVKNAVKLICDKMKVDFTKAMITVGERLGQDKAYVIDSSKIRRLGWSEQTSLDKGLRDVISWIDKNWQVIKNMPSDYKHTP